LITPSIQAAPAVTQSAPIKEVKPVKEVVDKVVESKPVCRVNQFKIKLAEVLILLPFAGCGHK
jgi:hypothetical protein